MNKKILLILLLGLIILIGLVIVVPHYSEKNKFSHPPFDPNHHQYVIKQAHGWIDFDLLDPEQAPARIEESVMRGYRLIMNTPFYAPKYAKDQLSCTNCHFFGGDTLGGRNNGISLVGVTSIYPQYSARDKKVITLEQRINNCFERSLSGKPLPIDSQEMQDLVSYMKWISKEVTQVKNIPWLGLRILKSQHLSNPKDGEQVYQVHCSQCHKKDGQGGAVLIDNENKTIPPLWGPNSFNDGAGMYRLPALAAFIYWNMPQNNSILTEKQALDVASFVLQKPRPHFIYK